MVNLYKSLKLNLIHILSLKLYVFRCYINSDLEDNLNLGTITPILHQVYHGWLTEFWKVVSYLYITLNHD